MPRGLFGEFALTERAIAYALQQACIVIKGANEPAFDKLQALRDRLGKPLIVRSTYRSPEHNRVVGGAKGQRHCPG